MLLFVIGVPIALCMILVLRIIRASIIRKKADEFMLLYSYIRVGMTKKQVITLMGNNFRTSFVNGREVLTWKCRGTSTDGNLSIATHVDTFSYVMVYLVNDVVTEYTCSV